MFKVVKERLVWWPVVWDVPVDGGKVEQAEIKMQFRLFDLDQLNTLLATIDKLEQDEAAIVDQWLNIVQRIASNWQGVVGDDDKDLDFNPDNVRALLSIPGTFNAIFAGYRGFVAGLPETRAKN